MGSVQITFPMGFCIKAKISLNYTKNLDHELLEAQVLLVDYWWMRAQKG